MTVALPRNPLPGADKPDSLAAAVQENFDVLAQSTQSRAFDFFGQFSQAFTLAAGAGAEYTIDTGVDLSRYPSWIPLIEVNYTGTVAGQNRIGRAYKHPGGTNVTIALFNEHSASVSGTVYFYIFAA